MQKSPSGWHLLKKENDAVVSFVDGFDACSEGKRRGAPPLYKVLRLGDGGEDPVRAWGESFRASGLRRFLPKKSPPPLALLLFHL